MFYFFWVVCTRQVHQMCGIFGNRFIIAQFLYLRHIVFEPYKFNIAVLDSPASEPDIHDAEHQTSDNKGDITSVGKLLHQCSEVGKFYNEIGRASCRERV